jgi:hypothetical protein
MDKVKFTEQIFIKQEISNKINDQRLVIGRGEGRRMTICKYIYTHT